MNEWTISHKGKGSKFDHNTKNRSQLPEKLEYFKVPHQLQANIIEWDLLPVRLFIILKIYNLQWQCYYSVNGT